MRSLLIAAVAAFVLASPALAQSNGVVASASPEATAAGVEVLEAGGNAIDAAVAVSMALGVTEPAGSGIGGQTQIIVHPPNGEPFVINGTSFSPAYVPEDASAEQVRRGRTASTVPSTVRVLSFAQTRFGSGAVSWADALAPAIRYADEGFAVSGFRYRSLLRSAGQLAEDAAARAIYLDADGRPAAEGATLRQPLLAETLRRLARDGAEDFYTGAIAREIAEDMTANGGWITYEDLAGVPEPVVMAPVHARYRGWDVYTLPPPAGGYVVLMALGALERAPQRHLSEEGAQRSRWLLRALRGAHADRREHPVHNLAAPHEEVGQRLAPSYTRRLLQRPRGGETTHFSVVDGDGMAVAVTQSIDSYFGAGVAHPRLGFLYNNYMQSLERDDPEHPFALGPRTPPYSSMSASIVARDGEPYLAVGSPGSARIISAVTQVISHWIDVDAGVEAAVAAERVHVVPNDYAYLEQRDVDPYLLRALAQDGFVLRRQNFGLVESGLDPYFGGVHAVAREGEGWAGAADPRRDGAVGFASAPR